MKAVQKGTIKCNFMGTALGDSWISPLGMFKLLRLWMICYYFVLLSAVIIHECLFNLRVKQS